MKFKISKSQWTEMGKKAGWMKKAQNIDIAKIIESIRNGTNEYFSYKHFHSSNMSDYTLMRYAIRDLVDVYGINEDEAASIVQSLTHGD